MEVFMLVVLMEKTCQKRSIFREEPQNLNNHTDEASPAGIQTQRETKTRRKLKIDPRHPSPSPPA